ncbi:hypothetical protein C8J27_103247 [Rhodobacter aestuarii]|uniref:Uncharacterized protein n=1 Tax=Rhodobacter aestuarii TaxID=453582 RepID=A0A1N7K073_9RHOB|nr:hypothetical protein C8J27_103247 [Rhodobacter aestuarii]SIS54906.1 hypothetical protein SAMN05421580_102187 [Rhodobacter aestuarii]
MRRFREYSQSVRLPLRGHRSHGEQEAGIFWISDQNQVRMLTPTFGKIDPKPAFRRCVGKNRFGEF